MKVFLPRFAAAALLFVLLVAIGTIGYQIVEGWSVGDSLYMTVITLTAVGYEEVQPLTDAGRTFTIAALIAGLSWMGLWFALISGAIRMASVLLRPSVVSFHDIATRSSGMSLGMEQTTIGEGRPLARMTLAEARIPQEDFVFNPVADTRLRPGDEMIVLGKEDQISRLREYAGA